MKKSKSLVHLDNVAPASAPSTARNTKASVSTDTPVAPRELDSLDKTICQLRDLTGIPLAPAKIRSLMEATANNLITAAENETRYSWIIPGKIVADFIKELKPRHKNKKLDAYKVLCSIPGVTYSPSHLRSLSSAHDLFVLIEGDDKVPKQGIAAYALILNSKLDFQKKKEFLLLSTQNDWTTRQLKSEIEAYLAKKNAGQTPFPINWKRLASALSKVNAIALDLRTNRPSEQISWKTAALVKSVVAELQDVLATYEAQDSTKEGNHEQQ